MNQAKDRRKSGNPAVRAAAEQRVAAGGEPRITWRNWVGGARLRTLPLAVAPVAAGAGIAHMVHGFSWPLTLLALAVGGGVALARSPEELTILEVVNAVEPIGRIKSCPLKLSSHGTNLCPLHRRLDDAMAAVEEAFGGTTLAEILAEPSSSVPLCEVPGDRKRVPLTVKKR